MMRILMRALIVMLAMCLCSLPLPSFAQNDKAAPPSAPTTVPASNPQQGLLSGPQLEALVSPIALYPDSLLSNVLMASTYPLEIVQAERWLKKNENLSGDALKAALDKQTWDDSVKALIATPPALAMMSAEIDWTQKVGDAVLAQQADVSDAIQRLRLKASNNGKLTTTPEQKVTIEPPAPTDSGSGGTQQASAQSTIVIDQANEDQVYVPAYDPAVVYGAWPYAEYPPSYWGYPGYWGYGVAPGFLARGLWFGAGFALGRWGAGNWGWGGRVNWGNGNIVRNWPRATPYNRTTINNIGNRAGNTWQHNPAHRGGVRYGNANVQQRFGNANRGAGAQRGNLGGIAAGAGLGAGAAALRGGQRTNAANRQGQRQNVGNRQGQRQNANRQGKRQNAGNRQGQRQNTANRTGNRTSANRKVSQRTNAGNRATAHRSSVNRAAHHGARQISSRGAGRASYGHAGGGGRGGGYGGGRGGGGGGRGGGGRRSDVQLKHDVVEVARLANGIGLYRFVYNGEHTTYVGVIAQEVQRVVPAAVTRGADGYLRVHYEKLGLKFQTHKDWLRNGQQ